MKKLLVINPNTSVSVTELLQRHVQAALGSVVDVQTVTARFGSPYISDEASYAIASHAALDAWAAVLASAVEPPNAILIGCFGDPGLLALQESSAVPVTGLAEAAFNEAALYGQFAVVTGGERWGPILQRLAQSLGHTNALTGIRTVAPTGAQLAADLEAAQTLLIQACRDVVVQSAAQAVILGGAGLAGMAAGIQPYVSVPVIDSVTAGAHWAMRTPTVHPPHATSGFGVSWVNLSPELTALGLPQNVLRSTYT